MTPTRIAVIGAGWSGCAAAVELARAGKSVTLFDAARTVGGRARQVLHAGQRLDNGQHILLGAYRETLALLQSLGIDTKQNLLTLPLQMCYPAGPDGMRFIAPSLPAPWHLLFALLGARGLAWADKLALARFSSTARWMDWRLDTDCSVSELLVRFDQTPRLTRLLWRPLCLAALNTAPEHASAQVFLTVLRDSLGARRAASDMLLPKVDLSTLFPQHAVDFVTAQGGSVRLGTRVLSITPPSASQQTKDCAGWQLTTDAAHSTLPENHFDAVIVATAPSQAASLLAHLLDPASLEFEYEAITTVYLQYPPTLKLPRPMLALIDAPDQQRYGQFVFDRGALQSDQAGLLAVVVSASTAATADGHAALANAIIEQLAEDLALPALRLPLWQQVISEKRATFRCSPGLVRPPNLTAHSGLLLAGDYTAGPYPATLEGAVRSGRAAAGLLIER